MVEARFPSSGDEEIRAGRSEILVKLHHPDLSRELEQYASSRVCSDMRLLFLKRKHRWLEVTKSAGTSGLETSLLLGLFVEAYYLRLLVSCREIWLRRYG